MSETYISIDIDELHLCRDKSRIRTVWGWTKACVNCGEEFLDTGNLTHCEPCSNKIAELYGEMPDSGPSNDSFPTYRRFYERVP